MAPEPSAKITKEEETAVKFSVYLSASSGHCNVGTSCPGSSAPPPGSASWPGPGQVQGDRLRGFRESVGETERVRHRGGDFQQPQQEEGTPDPGQRPGSDLVTLRQLKLTHRSGLFPLTEFFGM